MVAFGEIVTFEPAQIPEILTACNGRSKTCSTLGTHLTKLSDLEGWQGDAADAAKKSAGRARVDVNAHGNEVWKVAAEARDCYNRANPSQSGPVNNVVFGPRQHIGAGDSTVPDLLEPHSGEGQLHVRGRLKGEFPGTALGTADSPSRVAVVDGGH